MRGGMHLGFVGFAILVGCCGWRMLVVAALVVCGGGGMVVSVCGGDGVLGWGYMRCAIR